MRPQPYSAAARCALEQAPADGGGFLALVRVNPMANFAAAARGLHKLQPVAAGTVALLRDDFDHIAIGEHVAQRHDLAVDLGANALMANFRVDGISEIDRSE